MSDPSADPRRFSRAVLLTLILAVLLSGPALSACGGTDGESETPEDVAQKLADKGFVTGEVITDGANTGVARGGKLDADAYLAVEYLPDGEKIYASIFFLSSPEDAEVMAREREASADRGNVVELSGDRVYTIAGSQGDLLQVEAAAEAP